MPAKLDAHSNLRFLYACFKHSNYTTVAYRLVAGEFGIKPPAARMRLMRLKGMLDALSSSASSSSASGCGDGRRKSGGCSSDAATATEMDKEGGGKDKLIGKSGKTAAKNKKGKACTQRQGKMADDDYDDDDEEEEEFLIANRIKRGREPRIKVEDGVEDGQDWLDDDYNDEPLAKRRKLHHSRCGIEKKQQSPYHDDGVCKLEDCDEESKVWPDGGQCLEDRFVDVKVEEDVGGSVMAVKEEGEEGLGLHDGSLPDYTLQEENVESQDHPLHQGKEKGEVEREVDEDMLDDILVTDDSSSWPSHATAVSELRNGVDDGGSCDAEEPMFENITLEN